MPRWCWRLQLWLWRSGIALIKRKQCLNFPHISSWHHVRQLHSHGHNQSWGCCRCLTWRLKAILNSHKIALGQGHVTSSKNESYRKCEFQLASLRPRLEFNFCLTGGFYLLPLPLNGRFYWYSSIYAYSGFTNAFSNWFSWSISAQVCGW